MEIGDVSSAEMFQHELDENKMITWILRIVGWLCMMFGLKMIVAPCAAAMSCLPCLGAIAESLSCIVICPISVVLTLFTIAIGWIWYRPLLGIGLLLVCAGLSYFSYFQI